jgi:hypothetical protein
MNADLFNLRPIAAPRLDDGMLQQAVLRIGKMTEGWEGGGTTTFAALLDDFRDRLRAGLLKGKSFEECTQGRRREWLLLSLYLNDLGAETSRAWLPPLDKDVAASILGDLPGGLKKHLCRLATQLYFTHYGHERLPCLEWMCWILEVAWRGAPREALDPVAKIWAEHADMLFAKDAPDKVAEKWKPPMSVNELADTFQIHKGGLFRERLLESLILSRLRRLSLADNEPELNDLVIAEKERKLKSTLSLGAAAVQILVNRSQNENSSMVPENWSEQLVAYACDPRIPNSEMQERWWGWATRSEKDVAIRALSKLSLQAFITLLEQSLRGTPAEHQFPARSRMLLNLFKIGKVIDARLVVHRNLKYQLSRTRNVLQPSWVHGGPQYTSFICLRCTDDVFLIEGTHSFALRGFVGPNSFLVKDFWTSPPKSYFDCDFRVAEAKCPIYQVHHRGDWIWDFVSQLRRRSIEWRELTS